MRRDRPPDHPRRRGVLPAWSAPGEAGRRSAAAAATSGPGASDRQPLGTKIEIEQPRDAAGDRPHGEASASGQAGRSSPAAALAVRPYNAALAPSMAMPADAAGGCGDLNGRRSTSLKTPHPAPRCPSGPDGRMAGR